MTSTRSSITNGSKGEVVLEKKGDKWDAQQARRRAGERAVRQDDGGRLQGAQARRPRRSKADDELKKAYELGPDKAVHVIAFKGADKKLDATFGKSGGLGDAMMLAGKDEIFLVKGYSSWTFARKPKSGATSEILKIDDANATGFEIDNKNGNFVFAKGDSGWTGTVKEKPIARLR